MMLAKNEDRSPGSEFYFTGKPCKRGHIAERRVDNSTCVECIKVRNAEYYRENLDTELIRSSRYKVDNKDKVKAASALWKKRNPEKVKIYSKNHYQRNKEKISAKNKDYRIKNKERLSLKAKEYKRKNPEKVRQSDAEKYIKNKEKIRVRSKKYRENNREAIEKTKREWHQQNPEKVRASRWLRKSRVKNAEGSFTDNDIKRKFKNQRGKCASCLCSIYDRYDIDHIYPISKGGSNYPENLQLLCRKCNREKSNKDPFEWAKERGMLL